VSNNLISSSPWITNYKYNPYSKVRLFCFPYAGAGASIFRTWADLLPKEIEVCPVQFPGRENRFLEEPFTNLNNLIDELINHLIPFFDKPFVFYGHSLGSLVAFTLANKLKEENLALPILLFLSGKDSPQAVKKNKNLYKLPQGELLEELGRLNGTPNEILNNIEMMELLLPLIRADFSMHDTYVYKPSSPLSIPISVFGGIDDHDTSYENLLKWKELTNKEFSIRMLPGDHFFLESEREKLIEHISKDILKEI